MLGNFGQANYAAAKAGIYGLTRTMSIELQKHRITVNAIAPIAKTRMTEDLPMFQGVDTLTPDHIAPAALFLASDLCGDRTGHVLAVAGARLYAFKVVETPGKFKDEEPTTACGRRRGDRGQLGGDRVGRRRALPRHVPSPARASSSRETHSVESMPPTHTSAATPWTSHFPRQSVTARPSSAKATK
jgi:hypothetical protein